MSASSVKTHPSAPPALSQSAVLAGQMGAAASPEIPMSLLLGDYTPASLNVTDSRSVSDRREVSSAAISG